MVRVRFIAPDTQGQKINDLRIAEDLQKELAGDQGSDEIEEKLTIRPMRPKPLIPT